MMAQTTESHPMQRHSRRIHFVGIGGTGMCGIAEVLLNLGYEVSGSDISQSDVIFRLRGLGARVTLGHKAENIKDVDVVVYSSAVTKENVEVSAALRRKIPVIRRAEMLAELMRMKYSIAVAGTHGKTTTTSLIGTILATAGLDPTVVVGGQINAFGANARLGTGEYLVAEADESDGTFLHLLPTIAIVTNIDDEHLDFYPDLAAIKAAFLEFVNQVPFYGFSVLCLDHPTVQEMVPGVEKRFFTYGFGGQADFIGEDFRYEGEEIVFMVRRREVRMGELRLRIPGRHNAYNSLAAAAVANVLDVPFEAIQTGLRKFQGISRRFERVGEIRDVLVVDDYGHHPEEIRATLRAAREAHPDRRLIVVFQPHRYTRTSYLGEAFHTSFYDSDVLLVAPIYAAGENLIEGIDSSNVTEGVQSHGHKCCEEVDGLEEAVKRLIEIVAPGDLVLTLGAGTVWKVGQWFIEQMARNEKRAENIG